MLLFLNNKNLNIKNILFNLLLVFILSTIFLIIYIIYSSNDIFIKCVHRNIVKQINKKIDIY